MNKISDFPITKFRSEFNLNPSIIYLNNGTHSIAPTRALDLADKERRAYEQNPTLGLLSVWRRLWTIQERVAHFFVTKAECLFLRPNVTSVMNDFIFGLSLPTKSEIWISDYEYGAVVNICRLRCQRDNLELKTLSIPAITPNAPKSAEEFARELLAPLPSSAKVLVLSHILTGTGMVLPLKEIARETRKRGVLLVVDGAHGPGSIPVNFNELDDVDFYAGNLHKWMMGPKGTAFGWVPTRNQDQLAPTGGGWTTYTAHEEFEGHGACTHRFQGRMLAAACQDFSAYLALPATLDLWKEYGPEAIQDRIRTLGRLAQAQVVEHLEWKCLTPSDAKFRGPLVSFEIPAKLEVRGFSLIKSIAQDLGVQVNAPTVRGKTTLRFSPHAYNTEEEICRAIKKFTE